MNPWVALWILAMWLMLFGCSDPEQPLQIEEKPVKVTEKPALIKRADLPNN
jgi:hypothetical protein